MTNTRVMAGPGFRVCFDDEPDYLRAYVFDGSDSLEVSSAMWQILGDERAASALDFRPPPAVPLFNGRPWFLPAVFAWMTLQDRVANRRG